MPKHSRRRVLVSLALGTALLVDVSVGAALLANASVATPAMAATSAPAAPVGGGQAYREPVVLSPTNGVLEVTLTAHQGKAFIDTASGPVTNMLVFGYEVQRGTSSNGIPTARNVYPAPTLQVDPGETLIVHLENEMTGLTITDYVDPAFTPAGEPVALYPAMLTSSPYNNHTHGLHVSPSGNSDNVLLNIPAGMTNTYTYEIPTDHPEGLYWYHTHRHMLTTPQTYRGLAGMLVIGQADGAIPAVVTNKLPVRTMALQYNYVFDRAGGQTVLNNPFWPAMVSTLKPASKSSLADGTYEPKLTPINFRDSKAGTQYFTAWWDGPLSVNNNRGVFQYLPSNLQRFVSDDKKTVVPADPDLPDAQRDLQYTVNGQFQPVISTPPGQTEIWVIGNFSEAGYMRVAVTETATGKQTPITVVAQDGNPYTNAEAPVLENGTVLLLPPATRYAIAVTMPATGGLQLEMPTYTGATTPTTSNMGILYTNNKTAKSPAVTGTITVDPANISYDDGFFVYPTQKLLSVQPAAGTGTTVPFTIGQPLGAYTSFVDLSNVAPDVSRTLTISGGFTNENSNANDPNTFAYEFDANQFPNIPLLQPRLNTTEQWNFVNNNNDEHPIHIHVNDYQVVKYQDPVNKVSLTDFDWGQDNQNTPAPSYDAKGNVIAPGVMSLRTEFQDFIGAYVLHCHRLNHEDNGLMAIINVIPEVTAYAAAVPGEGGRPTRVTVYDESTRKQLARVTPFGSSTAPVDVAMGDVNGDMILDLIVGGGAGAQPRVKVFSGAEDAAGRTFSTLLVNRLAFDAGFRGGVSVASANLDGTQVGDSVIVGSGPGMRATVKAFAAGPRSRGTFATWHPYGSFRGGVDVATGLIDDGGRESVVTAPGPGMEPRIKTWMFDLYTPNGASGAAHQHAMRTSSFLAFEDGYTGGVNVATGSVAGKKGGFSRIIAGKQSGASTVSVFTSGSALTGHPEMYLMPADDYAMMAEFTLAARFDAFPGSTAGVDVTTSANPKSADLVVSGSPNGRATLAVLDLFQKRPKDTMLSVRPLDRMVMAAPISAVGGK